MISITVAQEILAPAKEVAEVLLNHAQLGRFFNAQISLVKPENQGELKGGQGAVRQISIGKITFKERILSANYHHICYQIIGNKPVANHQGDIYLTTNSDVNNLPKAQINNNHELKQNKAHQHNRSVHSKDNTDLTNIEETNKEATNPSFTHVNYIIKFNGLAWLPDLLLKFLVKRDISAAMQGLAEHFTKQQRLGKSSGEMR
jgi:hypothetical protein